jgi:uncharacterized protein YjbI with pentapeptide repeats
VLFYLAVAAGAVTHADLFLENPVKLPFLNIELPLLAFFFLAPILFIIVHAYTLVHLVMLTDKAKRYNAVMREQIGDEDGLLPGESERRKAVRDELRRQLPSNIFIQFLAGPADIRDSWFGWLLRTIAWTTLVIAPVLLLLLLQFQFLPYHYGPITWIHRGALLADLILVWWLWRKILSARGVEAPIQSPSGSTSSLGSRFWKSFAFDPSGIAASLLVLVVLFSWFVATFPGEWQEASQSNSEEPRATFSLHDWIFNSPFDPATGRRRNALSATLVLPALNIYDGLKIDDPKKTLWRNYVFVAGRRDLRGAIFDSSLLPKVDFTGAQLQGASLLSAQLQGASFNGAQLQGAFFQNAQLQGASLFGAQLQGASLAGAQLHGANLEFAQLPGGNLQYTQLQGAALTHANLDAASLDFARLQGALLEVTQLRAASLEGAQFQGAWLFGTQLQGASLERADLYATDLSHAFLWRTRGGTASLRSAAHVESISLPDAPETWQPLWRDEQMKVGDWNERAYQTVRSSLNSVQVTSLRNDALARLRRLDCANPDSALASCDRSAAPTAETLAWQAAVEGARVDETSYFKALAITLEKLVCSGAKDSIHVLRGLLQGPSPRLDLQVRKRRHCSIIS